MTEIVKTIALAWALVDAFSIGFFAYHVRQAPLLDENMQPTTMDDVLIDLSDNVIDLRDHILARQEREKVNA
jgi:hypothetical protein